MRKKLFAILGILFLFITITGCSKKDNDQVVDNTKTWYMFQDQGEADVISIRFLKNDKAVVKDILSLGDSVGINRMNNNNTNPSYELDRNGKTIVINSSNKVAFKLLKPYKENVYGKHMKGYYVQYQGQTYKFGYITKTDKKTKNTIADKSKSQSISYSSLPDHIINVDNGATELKESAMAGNYNFSTIINYRRTDGNLTVNNNGTYQMTMTEHAAQPDTDTIDSKVVMATTIESGQVQNLYGKVYLVPRNFLTISYYFHGQNQSNLLPKNVNLKVSSKATGNQIKRARTRIEVNEGRLYLFSSDFTVRKQEGQTVNGNLLTTSDQSQVSLRDAITRTYNVYQENKANPVQSNADFMQLAAAISDNNDKKLGKVAVDFGGKYGIDQVPTDYQGVDVDGNNQPLMQYLFLVTPATYKENGPTITTNQGRFLIYGMLNKRLFLLKQPDKDSTTVTWTLVNNVSLKVPTLQFTLD